MNLIETFKQLKNSFLEVSNLYLFGFLMLICFVGLFSSIRHGSANLSYYSLKNVVQEWEGNVHKIDEISFHKAVDALKSARKQHISHPLYRDLTGYVVELGVFAEHFDSSLLQSAKESYKSATKIRPTWPITWGSLALIKLRLQELDEEFLFYLDQAHRLGEYNPEIHVIYAKIGLILYHSNSPFFIERRELFIKQLHLGLRNSHSNGILTAFINDNNYSKTVCRWITNDEWYSKSSQNFGCG